MMIPLSLYIHIPWCVQKCPYCDFNSHALKQGIPEQQYIDALLTDLAADIKRFNERRPLTSIFIGGGTPSLFSADGIAKILAGVNAQLDFADDIEITLEANPGTVEIGKFEGFQQAGVNRISIGVQSFEQQKLTRLGRIHGPQEAVAAARHASTAGLNSYNLDLMHGLPDQSVEQALDDLRQAIDLNPPHLSWYQLTIEPNTLFASRPPQLPEDDILWDIQLEGQQILAEAGYQQYEISGYAKPDQQCRHNLNYWRFGDYLGIGCGAHGKITQANGQISRTEKVKHPKGYLDAIMPALYKHWRVQADDLSFEYVMNRFRLREAIPKSEFSQRTGLDNTEIQPAINAAISQGLLKDNEDSWLVSAQGHRYLNNLLTLFM